MTLDLGLLHPVYLPIPTIWLVYTLLFYLSIPLFIYVIIPYFFYGTKSTQKRIIVYVVGDIGHSPRICNHARSFSLQHFQVELCGYIDSKLPDFITSDPNITLHPITRVEGLRLGLFKKVLFQCLVITKHLWQLRGSDYILVQNPPNIPLFPIAALYKLLFCFTRCKWIIDWHNLGYSVLRLKLKTNNYHPLVMLAISIEYFFAKFFADYHLTVTEAMKGFLVTKFGINSKRCVVLYDRPAEHFSALPMPFQKYRAQAIESEPFIAKIMESDSRGLNFNFEKGDKIIVTSTSFTPDEDIGILLTALKQYETEFAVGNKSLPRILCIITGKGPMKDQYVRQVAETKWQLCRVEFGWLSPEEYPRLLQVCDYGVSLHYSTSGLDLPMKVLDMFGAGLPVIARAYPVLSELVTDDVNGLIFTNATELCQRLLVLARDSALFEKLKDGALKESRVMWQLGWEKAMKQIGIIH